MKNANCHSQTSPCHSKVSNCHSEALAEESKTSPCHSERALATEESLKSSLCHSKSSLEGEISPTSSPFHSEALAEESQDSTKDSKRYFANAQYDKISPQYDKINAQDNKETYHSKVSNCHSEASAEVSQTSPYHSSLSHYHSKSSLEGEISPTSPSCHSEALAEESQTDSTKDSSLALQVQNDKVKDISASPHACLTQPTHTCKDDNDKNLATLYHYDLYGKRKDKYNFLYDNSLDSVAWTKLKPKAPFYLFIPQNESLREEYNKGWSVKDIFRVSGVGITTAHDEFVIHSSKEKLLQKFEDFKNSPPDAAKLHEKFNVKEKQGWDILKGWHNLQKKSDLSQYIQKIAYRPFDNRYIFYEEKLVWRCVKDIMRHFLPLCHSEALAKESKISPCHSERSEESQTDSTKDSSLALQVQNDKVKDISASPRACLIQPTHTCKDDKENKQYSNKALLVSRQTSAIGDKEFNTAFISDKMVDINFYRRGGEQVSPLYLKDQASNTQRVENFTSKFRAFIDSKYQWDINDYQNNPEFFLSFDFENSHCHSQTSPCHSKSSLEGEVSPTSPSCHTEALAEESQTDSTKDSKRYFANAQYDKINAQDNKETYHSKVSNYHSESSPYHSEASNCHSEALAEESKTSPFHSKPSLEGEESLNKASKVSQFILTPEAILGYIYAVLFHKDYREKYIDFLKTDFPKIPFVESKEKFLALSALGRELMAVHLMQDSQIREREREREQKMMRMNCNIGLNVARQYKISGSWQCVIVTNTLVDLSLMGGGNTGAGMIFPLYLYPKAK
nr:type ISP restriction/modification enzyme [Helicobacter sp. MIT 14-3879]